MILQLDLDPWRTISGGGYGFVSVHKLCLHCRLKRWELARVASPVSFLFMQQSFPGCSTIYISSTKEARPSAAWDNSPEPGSSVPWGHFLRPTAGDCCSAQDRITAQVTRCSALHFTRVFPPAGSNLILCSCQVLTCRLLRVHRAPPCSQTAPISQVFAETKICVNYPLFHSKSPQA